MIRAIALLLALASSAAGLAAAPEPADVRAARALFRANLEAIARRDRQAYLACYLNSTTLARVGPEGPRLGYEELAKTAGEAWPDTFEAKELQLIPVRPGVVYGTYRYRVRYGADERSGVSERVFVRTQSGWKIAVTSAFDAPPGTPPPPLALVGATLVDGSGSAPVPDAVVLLRSGRIDCAGPQRGPGSCQVPEGVETLDLKGQWILPGLVDAHVHFSQTGWADGRPDAFDVRDRFPYEKTQAELKAHPERYLRSYLCSGVTAVFDVGGFPWTIALADRVEPDTRGPHVVSAGPLLSTIDFWLGLPSERQFIHLKDEEAGRAGVRYLHAQGADAVKVWYIVNPERTVESSAPAVLAAGEEAGRLGLPLIVHATGLAEAKVALKAGARLLVHGVTDRPVDDELIGLAKASGAVYCPTLTVGRGYRRLGQAIAARGAPAIDDPNGCVDPQTLDKIAGTARLQIAVDPERAAARARSLAERESVGAANLKRLQEAGVTIAMGTDAGNPMTLHGASVYAEMEAMQAAGLTPMQVIAAATRGGAVALGREKDLGTVEKGKLADLVVVAADPTADMANLRKVRYVVRGGVVRTIEELSAVARQGPLPR